MMPRRRDRPGPLDALLGRGATYEGDLSFEGRVRIDGLFRGRIYTDALLEVGEHGRIEGEVDAEDLLLAGRLDGRIKVRGLLTLAPTARVTGEIDAASLRVEPGAVLRATVLSGR